jgi:formiminoglutamase
MSGGSSSPGAWWSLLEPAPEGVFYKRGDPDDPRLGEVVQRWTGGSVDLCPGQPVLLGFPCDEGVRRNGGRVGAAQAPDAIRQQLYRFTTWQPVWTFVPETQGPRHAEVQVERSLDLAELQLFDVGNIRVNGSLEAAQERLGTVVGTILKAGATPIILGGGHETAYGHYLGYVQAGMECGIINVDAHLDVRLYPGGGHSGSPFRQAIEHPTQPLKRGRYVVIGAQSQSVARAHWEFVQRHQGRVYWFDQTGFLVDAPTRLFFALEVTRLATECPSILVTVDADAFRQGDVPGTSAPSSGGFLGQFWPALAARAGAFPGVRSIEMVEVNPMFDRDNQTVRWAALGIRQFLVGLAQRTSPPTSIHN